MVTISQAGWDCGVVTCNASRYYVEDLDDPLGLQSEIHGLDLLGRESRIECCSSS